MSLRLLTKVIFTIFLYSCSPGQNLTIAYTEASSLKKGTKVFNNNRQVGYVKDFEASKNLDTIYLLIKVDQGIKIPKGSTFYLDEELLGSSRITIEYSAQPEMLTSRDISIGFFRPLKSMTGKLDSASIDLKKINQPKIDTLKN